MNIFFIKCPPSRSAKLRFLYIDVYIYAPRRRKCYDQLIKIDVTTWSHIKIDITTHKNRRNHSVINQYSPQCRLSCSNICPQCRYSCFFTYEATDEVTANPRNQLFPGISNPFRLSGESIKWISSKLGKSGLVTEPNLG